MLDMKFSPLVNVFALPLLLFLWLLTTPAAHSLVVDGLYLQEIAVIDQGDLPDRLCRGSTTDAHSRHF